MSKAKHVPSLEWELDAMKGGPGSGHFGHAGRPGKRGGSAPRGGGAVIGEGPPRFGEPDWNELDEEARLTLERQEEEAGYFIGEAGDLADDYLAEHLEGMRHGETLDISLGDAIDASGGQPGIDAYFRSEGITPTAEAAYDRLWQVSDEMEAIAFEYDGANITEVLPPDPTSLMDWCTNHWESDFFEDDLEPVS